MTQAKELPTTGAGRGFRPTGRISPYFDGVERAGGGGYGRHLMTYVPWRYPEDPAEQYRAVTERVTLWDTACERQIRIRGRDALAFADRLVTRDLSGFSPGRCTYTFVCDEAGWIIGDPVLLVVDAETVWLSISSTDLQLWVKGIALGSGAAVEVDEVPVAPLQLQGPRSRALLNRLLEAPIDDLGFFRCRQVRVAGHPALVSRSGWSGELGYEIYPDGLYSYPAQRQEGLRLWDRILEAGADLGLMVTPFLPDRAYESGLCVFNHNEGEKITPLEFWRERLVDFGGGDFIGKAALEAVRKAGGPRRRMVGLKALDPAVRLEMGEWDLPVLCEGREVGSSRRIAYSYALGRAISLALVGSAFTGVGQRLQLLHAGGLAEMEAAALPFIDPEGRRVRA